MADRTLAKVVDWNAANDTDGDYVMTVERSAAGQPGLLFTVEYQGEYCGCVVVKDGNEFLAPVLEWLAGDWTDRNQVSALAKVIWEASRRDEGSISAMGADVIARSILAHGWNRQAAADKAALLRDVATSLIDWDVMYGHEEGTPEDEINHKIAGWIWDKAELLEKTGGKPTKPAPLELDALMCQLNDGLKALGYIDGVSVSVTAFPAFETEKRLRGVTIVPIPAEPAREEGADA